MTEDAQNALAEFLDKCWWTQETDKITGSWRPYPYDNFFIGSDPTAGMCHDSTYRFGTFINVSDAPCATFDPPRWHDRREPHPEVKDTSRNIDFVFHDIPQMHWFPIDEFGEWGYEPFFWSKRILDHLYARKDGRDADRRNIYLHCKAGKHRSPMIFLQWLLSRGHKLDEAIKFTLSDKHERQKFESTLRNDIAKGHIPGNLPELHKRMNAHPEKSLAWVLKHNESGERHALQ